MTFRNIREQGLRASEFRPREQGVPGEGSVIEPA